VARPAPLAEIVQLALSADEPRRCALAARHDSPPELLMLLAGDDLTDVRAAVAANPAAPGHADRLLCQDPVIRVRASLARKLGAAAAALIEAEWSRRRPSRDALLLLAQDADATVRAALAIALADRPDAPRELLLTLARDVALAVCEQLILRSAALDEAALLALVREAPHTRPAVTRRTAVKGPVAGHSAGPTRPCTPAAVEQGACHGTVIELQHGGRV
jgi:hypothetical protein